MRVVVFYRIWFLLALLLMISCQGQSKITFEKYIAPNGIQFERGYLRHLVVLDNDFPQHTQPNTLPPSMVTTQGFTGFSIIPNRVGYKTGLGFGFSGISYEDKIITDPSVGTFVEYFYSYSKKDFFKKLERNSIGRLSLYDGCDVFLTEHNNQQTMSVAIDLEISSENSVECSAFAHLIFFGVLIEKAENVRVFMKPDDWFTDTLTLNFDKIIDESQDEDLWRKR